MCTVTIVPTRDGSRIVMNRDERRTRADALVPLVRTLGHTRTIFPVDPEGGGTWIGANAFGVAVALLNRSEDRAACERSAAWPSRGLIIPDLLDAREVDEALERVSTLDVHAFRPFRLVIVKRHRLALVDSRISRLARSQHAAAGPAIAIAALDQPVMFTSSSLGDVEAERVRRPLFAHMMRGTAESWLERQARFHAHHWPTCPELSVMMSRPDARTVSRTSIDIDAVGIRMRYEALVDRAALREAA